MHDVTYADIHDRMGFHPADTDLKRKAHETARTLSIAHACAIKDILPPGREKSLALTALQDALMWANAALAINGGPKDTINDPGDLDTILADFNIHYGSSGAPVAEPITGSILRDAEGAAIPL